MAHREREHEHRAGRYRGVQRESSGVQRPDWAKGMSEERVRAIAKRVGRNPNTEHWWQGANLKPGTSEYKYAVLEAGAARKKRETAGPRRGRSESRQAAAAIARRSATGAGDLPF